MVGVVLGLALLSAGAGFISAIFGIGGGAGGRRHGRHGVSRDGAGLTDGARSLRGSAGGQPGPRSDERSTPERDLHRLAALHRRPNGLESRSQDLIAMKTHTPRPFRRRGPTPPRLDPSYPPCRAPTERSPPRRGIVCGRHKALQDRTWRPFGALEHSVRASPLKSPSVPLGSSLPDPGGAILVFGCWS